MNKEILKDIKQKKTYEPEDSIFDRVMSGIENCKSESDRQTPSFMKTRIFRPALAFYIVLILLASSFAVTAAVNADVREYLASIFGGNPNPVEGELIGVTTESDGVQLTVDAVVAEGDSLFMIYTLRDKEGKVFSDITSINSFKFSVENDPNYNAVYNGIIKDGEKNYMVLKNDNMRKGVHQVQFTIEGLKTPDPSKEFSIPIGAEAYRPSGIDGYVIDYVRLKNNRIEAQISISDQSLYVHNFNIRAVNAKTGEIVHEQGETTQGGSEGNAEKLRWYSEKISDGTSEDYRFVISFDKVYTFEKPLQADFKVDFSRKPVKTIYPKDTKVLTATIDKVTVHQMSIIADLTNHGGVPSNVDDKPIPVSEAAETAFLDEPVKPTIPGLRMTVRYEDGAEAPAISASASPRGENQYRFYLVLNGSLDYNRKPALFIGDVKIPLY